MLCTNKCTAASYCRSRNNCRSIDIIIIIVVIIILVIIIMKLAISFSKLRLETDEIKLTLKNRFWQLCLLTNNYSTILHFFGNMIFQSIFHAIIALVKYVFWQGSTNCSILPPRKEDMEQRECREHGKDGKHQPGDLKVKYVFIQNSLFVTQNTLFGNQMTQSTLFYGFNVES